MKNHGLLDGQIEYQGDTWKIINVGSRMDDGTTYLHLVSTTKFLVNNRLYPQQIGLYATAADLARVKKVGDKP
jgi:hypothetical protein